MARKELKPIRESKELVSKLRKRIEKYFFEALYSDLLKIVAPEGKIQNSKKYQDALRKAIQSGRIGYTEGQFKGDFNAHITKALKSLGAKWDRRQGSFLLPSVKVPKEIKAEIAASEFRFKKIVERLDKTIKKISPEFSAKNVSFTEIFDKEIFDVDNEIKKRVEKFSVYPKMSTEQREKIAEFYNTNMNLYIQKFTEEEIIELRGGVEKFIQTGSRPEQMRKFIMQRYGVSKNKAKFLARQESNLLVTELQKQQYTKAGINKYKWKTVVGSAASPVRSTHKVHDNKIYSWDNPPLVGDEYLHPGQDYNCRCVAIPVLEV